MPSTFELWMDGAPAAPDFYDRISLLEVEENADAAGSLLLRISVSGSGDGDVSTINDSGIAPLKNIAVVATPDGGQPSCLFDGYILSHKIHLESGLASSYVEVYAQDASWLMNLEEKTREWAGATDSSAASRIFGEYGFTDGPDNAADDSGPYSEDDHTLMQRGTDLDFLKMLARRAGRLLRVSCGPARGIYTGVFAQPNLQGESVASLRLNDPEAPNVGRMDFEWDVMRPAAVTARQALFTDTSQEGANGDATASGFAPLDSRDFPSFAGKPMKVMLTAPAGDAGQLRRRAEAVLRESQWFVRCTGEVDLAALRVLLRAGDIATVETVGSVHSGKYLVWTVRHRIGADRHLMDVTMVRNAVGPAPSPGGGLPGGL